MGHEVRMIEDFQNVMPVFAEYDPHMVLVDIVLPFYDGYHWCGEIRKISRVPVMFISSASDNTSAIGVYGGLFFLGVFLGVLFIMAAVLIIYYKQISEGYDDRERFIIMRKVGMTQAEIKSTIRSQVLTVFFLPLIAAGIHVAVAFSMISLILALLNMTNVNLYLTCTVICFLVFAGMYVAIYSLTAKTYYKIVSAP